METLKAFLAAMTFWNWIALIAFIFFPLSVLNSILNLKARYRDWRGSRNKKTFERRTHQLREEIEKLEDYKTHPPAFFIDISYYVFLSITALLFSVLLFNCFFLISSITDEFSIPTARVIAFIGMILTFLGLIPSSKALPLILTIKQPAILCIEVIDFARRAAKKGLNSKEADDLIISLMLSDMIPKLDKRALWNYVSDKYPALLNTIVEKFREANRISNDNWPDFFSLP